MRFKVQVIQTILAGCVSLTVGCSSQSTPQEMPESTITWYSNIKPIFDAHCNECHTEGGIAPFELTSIEGVTAAANLIPGSIQSRRMPPFLAAPAKRPLQFDTSLSELQINSIIQWIAAGLPLGDSERPGDAINLPTSELSRVDRVLRMPQPYTPSIAPDEYRCFVMEWADTEIAYITGFNILPGNLSMDHHAALFMIDASNAAVIDMADGADGQGIGYPCFGSAAPPGFEGMPNKLLGAWTPGGGGLNFPEGTGIRVDPGAKVILQMHYSVLEAGLFSDQTGIELKLESSVTVNAGNLPWLDIGWPSDPESMRIPAGASDVSFEHVSDPTVSPLLGAFAPGVNPSEGLILHGVLPHMHKLGQTFWLQIERADGSIERFFEIAQWDFDWQGYYVFKSPLTLLPGDQLRMHCSFNNRAQDQPFEGGQPRDPVDVMWGEGSADEMCTVSMYVNGVASSNTGECDEGMPAEQGQFEVTFDTSAALRNSDALDGEFVGPVSGSIYRADDVGFTGPKDGTEPVANFNFDRIDLRSGADGPHLIDTVLPAGAYQFLGYMDTDGNSASSDGPDINDPIMIPARPSELDCQIEPVTIQFPLLMPDL
jgi:hypothetical protein